MRQLRHFWVHLISSRPEASVASSGCEALGSSFEGRKLGCHGLAGSFSFYYGHHISTIEGGMVVTNHTELYQLMLSLRSHGWSRDLDPKLRADWQEKYKVDEFRNLYTFYHAGFNLRSTDLQAHIGLLQLEKLDRICEIRARNHETYARLLPDFFCQKSETEFLSSFAYGTLVENRMEVSQALKAQDIECRPLICGNIARHPFWIRVYGEQILAHADLVHEYGIYLPNHHNLTSEDIDRVTDVFKSVARPLARPLRSAA